MRGRCTSGSRASAAGTISLSTCAPKLPPTTAIFRLPWRSAKRFSGEGRAAMSARTGLPTSPSGYCGKAWGKAYNTRAAHLASRLFAMPATAFCSCTKIGTPSSLAASPPGKVTKPPKPITALIWCLRMMALAACTQRSSIKGRASLRSSPLPRTPFMAMSSSGMLCCGTRRCSMLSWLPSQITLCPCCCRDWATARAGKMCPPVPPAIRRMVLGVMVGLSGWAVY